jgi:hypothetical protein
MKENEHDTPEEALPPFSLIAAHFEKRGIRSLSIDWERKSLFFQMYERQVVMGCSFNVSEEDDRLEIFLRYPFFVADERMRPSVAELVARVNYGLRVGTFEFDMKDGEVRYHVAHLMENFTLGEDLLLRLFNTAMSTTDRYFPAFMQHIYSGATPEDAVFMAELDLHADRVGESPAQESRTPEAEKKKDPAKRRPGRGRMRADDTPLLLEQSGGSASGDASGEKPASDAKEEPGDPEQGRGAP